MSCPNEDQLILLYYGEAGHAETLQGHIDSCKGCAQRYRALAAMLGSVHLEVPERGPDYGRRVWNAIRNRLPEKKVKRAWFRLPAWTGPAFAAAFLLVLAFMAGRISKPDAPPVDEELMRQRALLAAVGSHLERAQVFLTEVTNRNADNAYNREQARYLVDDNRLMRQAAWLGEEIQLANFLDELEIILVELANRSGMGADSVQVVTREERTEIIFKIRVFENHVRERRTETMEDTRI
ncbi:MAG: hypothetical protein QNK37_10515 [Acidobacteriota bacterium]|nr:hypothetical protein [Acidobacteriota bacterium]